MRYLCELPQGHRDAVDPWALNAAMVSAAQNGHSNVVRYLCELPLDRGVDPSANANRAVRRAVRHLDVVRYLCELPLDRGVDPSADNNSAVRNAASRGHVDVVRYLCELPLHRGVDPSNAACTSHVDVVRYLCELPLDRGVDPSADHNHAIKTAASGGHVDVVRYLCELPLDRGVDPSADNNSAVRSTTYTGRVDVVRYLCELPRHRGVDPVRAVHFPDGVSTWANPRRACLDLVWYLWDNHVPKAVHLQIVRVGCNLLGLTDYMYGTAPEIALNSRHGTLGYRSRFGRMAARQPLLMLRAVVRAKRSDAVALTAPKLAAWTGGNRQRTHRCRPYRRRSARAHVSNGGDTTHNEHPKCWAIAGQAMCQQNEY